MKKYIKNQQKYQLNLLQKIRIYMNIYLQLLQKLNNLYIQKKSNISNKLIIFFLNIYNIKLSNLM